MLNKSEIIMDCFRELIKEQRINFFEILNIFNTLNFFKKIIFN